MKMPGVPRAGRELQSGEPSVLVEAFRGALALACLGHKSPAFGIGWVE